MSQPSKETAKEIIQANYTQEIIKLERFTTGLCHFVYDIKLADNSEFVLRISGSNSEFHGGIFWNEKLKNLNIPVPDIIINDTFNGLPYSIHKKIVFLKSPFMYIKSNYYNSVDWLNYTNKLHSIFYINPRTIIRSIL